MSAEMLARIQFGLTSAFHYIYPPITIGLGVILVIMEGLYLKTKNEHYRKLAKFWVGLYAINFAVGVATGVVLEFQFGTNWSRYSRYVGDIFGSALAAEGIFAFFLESGFLGILIFGWDRVSKGWHFFATCMVALGAHFSAIWIIVANSWQQTPAGYVIEGTGDMARARIVDFWAMVFNPSTVDRLSHTLVAAYATGAFFVISVCAYYYLKNRELEIAKSGFKIAIPVAIVACLGQFVLGHLSTVHVATNQPSKFAAMEGHADGKKPIDLVLLGYYDSSAKEVKGLKIPGAGTALLEPEQRDKVKGLNDFDQKDLPPIQPTFQSFHGMVALGVLMTILAIAAAVQFYRGKLQSSPFLLRALIWSVFLPHLANDLGWMTAEIGRQPWTVYGLLRTDRSHSPVVSSFDILLSIGMFTMIYALLLALYLYLMDKKIKAGTNFEHAEHGGETPLQVGI